MEVFKNKPVRLRMVGIYDMITQHFLIFVYLYRLIRIRGKHVRGMEIIERVN